MKKIGVALLTLVALALVVAGGAALYLRSAEAAPDRDGTIAGLGAPVEVWRDSLGVPHLWAGSEADLYRAVGYVHAQDRLWQMELFRRVADGRLAEVLGPDAVDSDRFLRTLGMGRIAAAEERRLSPDERALLQAYADGVNAAVGEHRGALPPEFVALRFRPEPWTPRNTLSIARIMAWDLADWTTGLELQRAADLLGPELARELRPYEAPGTPRILGGAAGAEPSADSAAFAPLSAVPLPRIPPLAARLLDGVSVARASNAWVIGGERTRSGRPILANDMHLELRAPSLWYLAALHGGPVGVAGMTIPGVPTVIAGRTARVAWGFTNAMVDDVDFFVEQPDARDPGRYRTPDGSERFTERAETIQVRGDAPVVHRVRATRHGPVLSDVEPRAGARILAMRWTAQDPSTALRGLRGMNRARNADEFVRALRLFDDPHQNVVFADADGRIGYWMAGRVPLRAGGGDGLLPVAGWTGEGEWTGYLGFQRHPHALNPAEGFVVTANNRQAGPDFPYQLGTGYASWRALRIREMVEAGRAFSAADVAAQQNDLRDAFAARHLPRAVRAAETAGEAGAAALLRGWNAEAHVDSHAAALFYTWLEALRRRIGADEYGAETMYFSRWALERVLDRGASPWTDDVRTPAREKLDDVAAAAMREAVRSVGGRSWGEIHPTRIEHPLGGVAALERMLGLNIGPFPRGGSPFTVDVAGYGGTRPPFVSRYGASQRHVTDLGDPDAGGFVLPTGQSGIPSSRHYRDQTPLWRAGRLWPIPLDRARAEARAVHRMVLRGRSGKTPLR